MYLINGTVAFTEVRSQRIQRNVLCAHCHVYLDMFRSMQSYKRENLLRLVVIEENYFWSQDDLEWLYEREKEETSKTSQVIISEPQQT